LTSLHDSIMRSDKPRATNNRSLLTELGCICEMQRGKNIEVSKAKQVLGDVFSVLNLRDLLRHAPHPDGDIAAEALRLTGGFELRWPVGPYDVDWGNPHFRIGVLVLTAREFVQGSDDNSLLAPARFRINYLVRAQGWRLVLLRADDINSVLNTSQHEPELFSPLLALRSRRANTVHPLPVKRLLWLMRKADTADKVDALSEVLFSHFRCQLDIVFPGAEVAYSPKSSASSPRKSLSDSSHQTRQTG